MVYNNLVNNIIHNNLIKEFKMRSDEVINTPYQKLFHHNNILLYITHDQDFDLYFINIKQINSNQISSPFGLFIDLQSAIKKFNTINL